MTKRPMSNKLLEPKIVNAGKIGQPLRNNREKARLYYNPGARALGDLIAETPSGESRGSV